MYLKMGVLSKTSPMKMILCGYLENNLKNITQKDDT